MKLDGLTAGANAAFLTELPSEMNLPAEFGDRLAGLLA